MKKKLLALVMAVLMAVTVIPAGEVFAADNNLISTNTAKSEKLKITKVKVLDPDEQYVLSYTWSKVSGAKYQYRYRTADTADYFKVKTTKKNNAKISFESYDNITFQVRTVKTVDGKKKYSKWVTKKLKAAKVDEMLGEALNLKEGYIKNGVIYIGGLYASDKNHSDCDLDILLFAYVSQTNPTIYIIQQGGKVINYGFLETEPKKLTDGTEYTSIKSPGTGANGKDEAYGYVFQEVENGSGYVITKDGKKVSAKDIDVSVAWEVQSTTE